MTVPFDHAGVEATSRQKDARSFVEAADPGLAAAGGPG